MCTDKLACHRSEWPPEYILGSPGMLHQRWPKNQQTGVRIILEFRNPNCILAEEFFDHVEREIAALEVNQFRRRTSAIDEGDKIGVRSDDRIAVLSCPIPDFFIARLLEADIAYMDQAAKQGHQAKRKPWRQILVEKQAQTRWARRPASAANW